MRIAILHDAIAPDAPPEEQDNLVQAETVRKALGGAGREVISLPCLLNLDAVALELRRIKPEAVFNLVESVGGTDRLIHLPASLLEALGIPYTGCPADALYLTSNKLLAKRILRREGIPTPEWVTASGIRAGEPMPTVRLIIKSLWEHASKGLDDGSLVLPADSAELLSELTARSGALRRSVFAERYVDGREFNLSLLETERGPRVLPPAEIRFEGYSGDKPRIVGYRAKWEADSFEYQHTVRRFDFPPEDVPLLEELCLLSRKCWEIFGLRGYARVDFRVDIAGRPFVLEINANPCLSLDAGFAAALAQAGLSHAETVRAILGFAFSPPQPKREEPERRPCLHPDFRESIATRDRPAIERLVRGTGFFSEAEVGIATELVDAFRARGAESGYRFLLYDLEDRLAGYACYGPIDGTASSFDLYWIVVDQELQRKRIGRRLLEEVERQVQALGGTRIYVDTSGRPLYLPTQRFYETNGYVKDAVLRDFYGPADDKIIYVKQIA